MGSTAHTDGQRIPCIVTNKHVIADAQKGSMHFHLKRPNEPPVLGRHIEVNFDNFESLWILHQDDQVDLAVFPFADLLDQISGRDEELFLCFLQASALADSGYMANRTAIEDIYMVGYPNGFWDGRNNLPIVRKGITASPVYADFEGRKEFMIDCACFPGSSGSPVFIHTKHDHFDPDGRIVTSLQSLRLAGIQYAAPTITAEGTVEFQPTPTGRVPVVVTPVMMNLGMCIKAEQLLWFEKHFIELLAKTPKHGDGFNGL